MSNSNTQAGDPNNPAAPGLPHYAPPRAKMRKWPAIVIGVVAFLAVMSAFSDKDDTKRDTKPSAALAAQALTEHRDATTYCRAVVETHRVPVDQDQVDLGVRNTRGLPAVFDGPTAVARPAHEPTTRVCFQQVVELGGCNR